MRVPVATESTVAPSITPGVRFNAPQVSNAGMEQVQQAGNAITGAAGAAAKEWADAAATANKSIYEEAVTNGLSIQMELESGDAGFANFKGKDALLRTSGKPLAAEYDDEYAKRLTEIRDALPNQAVKDAFDLQMPAMRRTLMTRANAHMVRQQEAHDISVQQGKAEVGGRLMVNRFDDPEQWAIGRSGVADAVRTLNKGMDKDAVEGEVRKALTPLHKQVISRMTEAGMVGAARDYFAKPEVQAEMTDEAKTLVSGVLTASVNDMEGQQAAREAIATNPGASMKELDAALVARFGSNPAALDVARREIKYQRDLEETSKRETESSLMRPVDSLLGDARLSGQSISRNQASAVLSPLKFSNPEAYAKATALIDAHNDEIRNERQAAEDRMSSLAVKSEEENAAAIKWDMVLNPDKYKNADVRAQLADLTGSKAIKPAGAAELLKLWQGIRDPSKGGNLKTMSTLAQYMDARLQGVMTGSPSDLKPFSGLGKPAQDAIRAKARAAIDRVMIDRQMSGQGISDKDARDIIDSMFVSTSIRSSFLGFSGASVPATKLDMTIGIPQAAIDFLKSNNTPQMRLEFDQKYGVGMAAAVTGK